MNVDREKEKFDETTYTVLQIRTSTFPRFQFDFITFSIVT